MTFTSKNHSVIARVFVCSQGMAARVFSGYGKVCSYSPPSWAQGLRVIPKSRVKLCMSPTPIHKWTPPHVPAGYEVSIKREDLTGSTLSGNKVRKLEFLLADALDQGCDTVITFGGLQSNHARATAIAAREVGLEPYIFALRPTTDESTDLSCDSNLLLKRLVGTNFVIFPSRTDISRPENLKYIHQQMDKFSEKLSSEGHKAYVIPAGGSSLVGAWGYIDAFEEMIEQGVLDDFDDIFVAAGSMGSACSLAISNHLTGSKLKIHAVATHVSEQQILNHIDDKLRDLGITDVCAKDIIDPVVEYIGEGYAHSTQEELDAIVSVMSETGISMDPEFSVKSYLGMVGEMAKNPSRLKGKRVLFIHTGGVYGLFDGRIDALLQGKAECNRCTKSSDLFS